MLCMAQGTRYVSEKYIPAIASVIYQNTKMSTTADMQVSPETNAIGEATKHAVTKIIHINYCRTWMSGYPDIKPIGNRKSGFADTQGVTEKDALHYVQSLPFG